MLKRRASALFRILPLLGLALPAPVSAQSTTFDDIWRFAEWYENDQNPVVQSVLFSGRFQYEYATVHDNSLTYDEWNVRRMRMGVRTGFLNQFTFHAEAEFNPQEADPFYTRLTDFYLEWSRGSELALTFGKQGVPFTIDGATSSKELLTIDRSNLANNMWFPQEYVPGISMAGEISNWLYHLGAYSSGERNREFGEFSGSAFTLATLGYSFAQALGVSDAVLRANYVYQNPDSRNSFTRDLQHMASLNFRFEDERWGTRADVSNGWGYLGQSDLWGTTLMPFLKITPKFQLVARHTYLKSDDPNGVRLPRYESQLIDGRGDRYNELYLGLNYFFYGHKLKLQSGLQFADMKDSADDGGEYSGNSLTTGLRVSW